MLPTSKLDVVYVVTPEVFKVAVPSGIELSLKITVPVGVLEPLVVTVAVNVTACPKLDGLSEETSVVVVAPKSPSG